jgi:hypothetical protein
MARRIATAAAIGFCSLMCGCIVHAQELTRAYLCGNLVGSYSGAVTSWKPEEDNKMSNARLVAVQGQQDAFQRPMVS